jgi:hypothetical protein
VDFPIRGQEGTFPGAFRLMPIGAWERLLRVNPNAKRSVVFVGIETQRGFVPIGTGFIGLVKYEDVGAPLVITARHVLDMISGDDFYIRLNRRDGTAESKRLSKSTMITFNDRSVDLAVIPAPIDAAIYDVFAIHIDSALWKKQIDDAGLGGPSSGDEVSIIGLYTTHYGHAKNMPVVRIGHIAAIPEEKVLTAKGYVNGFLVEVHSIAGLSGSPVFWNLPPVKIINDELQYLPAIEHIPIGIFTAYHVIQSRDDEAVVPQFQTDPADWQEEKPPETSSDERRTGFGVVLPINFIFEIFEGDEMKKKLSQAVEEHRKASGHRDASAAPPTSDENPTHREDFMRLVGAAARKPPQEG